jgi:hypothetical protein
MNGYIFNAKTKKNLKSNPIGHLFQLIGSYLFLKQTIEKRSCNLTPKYLLRGVLCFYTCAKNFISGLWTFFSILKINDHSGVEREKNEHKLRLNFEVGVWP